MRHGWATATGLLLVASVAHSARHHGDDWEPRSLLLDASQLKDGCDIICSSFDKTNPSSLYAACFACCTDQCAAHGTCGDSKVDKNGKCQCFVSYMQGAFEVRGRDGDDDGQRVCAPASLSGPSSLMPHSST